MKRTFILLALVISLLPLAACTTPCPNGQIWSEIAGGCIVPADPNDTTLPEAVPAAPSPYTTAVGGAVSHKDADTSGEVVVHAQFGDIKISKINGSGVTITRPGSTSGHVVPMNSSLYEFKDDPQTVTSDGFAVTVTVVNGETTVEIFVKP